jgi:hypothetical protein
MKVVDFKTLKKFNKNDLIKYRVKESSYHKAIIDSDIPFKPGVYLMYAVKNGDEKELLYFGKAGMNKSDNLQNVNGHPLPMRLLASEAIPKWHNLFDKDKKKYLSRTKLIPDKLSYSKFDGLNIYWFQTYPKVNCTDIEKAIKTEWLSHNKQMPLWMHH